MWYHFSKKEMLFHFQWVKKKSNWIKFRRNLNYSLWSCTLRPYLTFKMGALAQSYQCRHQIKSFCAVLLCWNNPECKCNAKSDVAKWFNGDFLFHDRVAMSWIMCLNFLSMGKNLGILLHFYLRSSYYHPIPKSCNRLKRIQNDFLELSYHSN